MSKNLISYKKQYYLSLIPIVGFLIAWITSWINIWRRTKDKKYIFLHYILWILPMCIVGGLVAVCAMTFMPSLTATMRVVFGFIIGYIACLIMSVSSIFISQIIIDKYDSKFIDM